MDNDDYRRGLLTTHKKFGHAMGVLAGDGLLNYAYEICAKAIVNSSHMQYAARAFSYLAEKAGIYGMVGGQTADVEYTGKELDEETLLFIHKTKTGALLQASMVCGAMLAGAQEKEIQKISEIALLVGLAFQVQDDILDVTSTTEMLGKPVFSDDKNHKVTFVSMFGLEGAREKVREYSNQAICLLDEFPQKNEFLRELLLSLISREK
jgi:geranylgeranyl diphosphate synthase type II